MKQIADYQISLKLILKNKNWETLILKTPENSSFKGYYDLPWGRIDDDEFETPYKDILMRELLEETGIQDVVISEKIVWIWRHKHKWKNVLYLAFEWVISSDETINISFEHNGFQFIKIENIDISQYFISGMYEVVSMYLNNIK